MLKKENRLPTGENKMATMPIGKLLINMATPIIIAMLVQAFYNIVDSFFVSRISDVDSETQSAIAAMSYAFPVQNLLIGFATGIGVGVNAMMSKSLGEGNRKKANQTAGNGILLAVLAWAIFLLFGIFGTKAFFKLQSDVPLTVEYGVTYTSICCIFSLGIFIEILGERLLQASGRTLYTMITQGTGAIINIILDPILIFGMFGMPRMGIAGAAVATVIGQWVAAGLAIFFNIKFNPDVQFGAQFLRPLKAVLQPILVVGVPSIIMTGIGSVMNFGINQILSGFEGLGETPTAVFGIYFKLQSFFFMPLFGLNNAAISIIAFNYGAKQPDRIKKALKVSLAIAMSFMLVGIVVFQLLPDMLLRIFNSEANFLAVGKVALRIISLHFPLAAICICLISSFQALGNGIYSTIVSLCRQLLCLLPVAFLLSLTGKVSLVWWAFPIAELVSATVTLLLFARIYRRKIRPLYDL